MNKMVSIITPTHNSLEYLESTITSILSQTFDNWELLITDDCSTDGTWEYLQETKKRDDRIKVFKLEKNSGPAIARNNSIAQAQGRFIAFLDSDDIWTSDKLEKQVTFMTKNRYYLTYTEYTLFDEDGDKIGVKEGLPLRLDYKKMLECNYIGCLTAMYDAEKIGKVYMPEIRKRQDYGLWLKILKQIDYAYCIKEPLAQYRVRSSSVSSNKLNLIKYNWKLFREVERLTLWNSAYYLSKNIINKIIK